MYNNFRYRPWTEKFDKLLDGPISILISSSFSLSFCWSWADVCALASVRYQVENGRFFSFRNFDGDECVSHF